MANSLEAEFLRAAEDGNTDCLKDLMKQGVDWACANEDGETALHITSGEGHINTVTYLVEELKMNIHEMTDSAEGKEI